ncbi:unnamed protein product [Prorocentrum cordatum]|uniref:Uncharacterized protein n=1 Tax=Prorocentrum cordatum TaxID=2364126 RepID=A0ABN9VYJ5_9DINO|nr:unnamed protein product [Polarella glacialis]
MAHGRPAEGPARLRVRAAACHLEPGAGEAPLGPAASSELSAAEVEARWGPSAASALEPLAPGAAALVAVPQAGRTAAQDLDGARAAVILLDVEALAEEASSASQGGCAGVLPVFRVRVARAGALAPSQPCA